MAEKRLNMKLGHSMRWVTTKIVRYLNLGWQRALHTMKCLWPVLNRGDNESRKELFPTDDETDVLSN